MNKIHSFFSYAGTKYRLIDFLKEHIKFNPIEQTWIEPFAGSCVTAFNFCPRFAKLNDLNKQLIFFWLTFRSWKQSGDYMVKLIEEKLLPRFKEEKCDFYHEIRNELNEYWQKIDDETFEKMISDELFPSHDVYDICAKFLFLTQSSFSHQLRYNNQGELNMAYSKFDYLLNDSTIKGLYAKAEELRNLMNDRTFSFTCMDWKKFLDKVQQEKKQYNMEDEDCFIYADPPYVGTNQDYIERGFNEQDQADLLKKLEELGYDFAISGSCNIEDDDKIIELYKEHRVVFKEYNYNVNSKGQRRVNEFLILK